MPIKYYIKHKAIRHNQNYMKSKIYDIKGKSTGDIDLPAEIFDLKLNKDLVHQVVVSMMSNQRSNIAHTKDRSEVSGGGKKPWKQKGTGRARHGSIRSPIWRGGGITFGPRKDRNYSKKINKKMKTKALFQILSQKMRDGEILFVDSLNLKQPKTKEAKEILLNLSKIKGFEMLLSKKKNSALLTNVEYNDNNLKSFSNFSNISLDELRKLNPLDLLKYKYLVVVNPTESVELLKSKIK